jgi:non-homologous end joining protein Ku
VKAYEIAAGEFVHVADEELEAAEGEKPGRRTRSSSRARSGRA